MDISTQENYIFYTLASITVLHVISLSLVLYGYSRKENAEQFVHYTTLIESIHKFIECTILSNNIGFGTF